jgi:hypothetical protein
MNTFDDGRLGSGICHPPEPPVGERELVVWLRISGREFGGPAQVLDGLGCTTSGDQCASQGDACFVAARIYLQSALKFSHSFFNPVAARFY